MENEEVIKILSRIYSNNKDVNEAIAIATINTLKQIKLKPYMKPYKSIFGELTIVICPTCGELLCREQKMCECGQKLNWEDLK